MAFPAYNGTKQHLDEVLARVRSLAHTIKTSSQQLRDASAAGSIIARRIVNHCDSLAQINDQLNTLKAVPGIGDYAKEQFNDANIDIAAEFTAMQNALASTVSWIATNMPKETVTNRWLSVEELVDGKRVDRTLTTAQTAGLRTQLDALIATID